MTRDHITTPALVHYSHRRNSTATEKPPARPRASVRAAGADVASVQSDNRRLRDGFGLMPCLTFRPAPVLSGLATLVIVRQDTAGQQLPAKDLGLSRCLDAKPHMIAVNRRHPDDDAAVDVDYVFVRS